MKSAIYKGKMALFFSYPPQLLLQLLLWLMLALLTPIFSLKGEGKEVPFCALRSKEATEIEIELAITQEAQQLGLMERPSLAPNRGLLFTSSKPKHWQFWMFHCYFDLDIALFDEQGILKEIIPLKSYPIWDRSFSIANIEQLKEACRCDPSYPFFLSKAVASTEKGTAALEMNSGWLIAQQVQIGDVLYSNEGKTLIIHTGDVRLLPNVKESEENPHLEVKQLNFSGLYPASICLGEGKLPALPYLALAFDPQGELIKASRLDEGTPRLFFPFKVKKIVLIPLKSREDLKDGPLCQSP